MIPKATEEDKELLKKIETRYDAANYSFERHQHEGHARIALLVDFMAALRLLAHVTRQRDNLRLMAKGKDLEHEIVMDALEGKP